MDAPTLVFDVDDVIAGSSPDHDYANAVPFLPGIKHIRQYYAEGYRIVFATARYMIREYGRQDKATQRGYRELERWLQQYDIPYHEIYFGKPSANIYVDDKGYRLNSKTDGEEGWDKLRVFIKETLPCGT